jgi:hypothetical protein
MLFNNHVYESKMVITNIYAPYLKGQSRGSATFLLLFLFIVGLAEGKLRRRTKYQARTLPPWVMRTFLETVGWRLCSKATLTREY